MERIDTLERDRAPLDDPYRPPQVPVGAGEQARVRPLPPLRGRTLATKIAVSATLAAASISLVFDVVALASIGSSDDLPSGSGLALAVSGFSAFTALLFGAGGIVSCFWIHRATLRVHVLDPGWRGVSPGWAVANWFVPFVFLFRPFQDMRSLWTVSHGGSSPRAAVRILFAVWWAAWLAQMIMARFADTGDAPNRVGIWVDVVDALTILASGSLFLWIVARIEKAQERLESALTPERANT